MTDQEPSRNGSTQPAVEQTRLPSEIKPREEFPVSKANMLDDTASKRATASSQTPTTLNGYTNGQEYAQASHQPTSQATPMVPGPLPGRTSTPPIRYTQCPPPSMTKCVTLITLLDNHPTCNFHNIRQLMALLHRTPEPLHLQDMHIRLTRQSYIPSNQWNRDTPQPKRAKDEQQTHRPLSTALVSTMVMDMATATDPP